MTVARWGLALAAVLVPAQAEAYERQWHAGISAGYALTSFPDMLAHGFDAGLHVTYGITDAFNLRMHTDVSAFDLPDPATSAVLVNTAFGGEYVFDILRWVPYIGATVGPNTVLIQKGPTTVRVCFEFPVGLGYQLSRNWTISAELRYRLLLLGNGADVSPGNNFLALGRAEYAWGS